MEENETSESDGLEGVGLLLLTWLLEIPGILVRMFVIALILLPFWLFFQGDKYEFYMQSLRFTNEVGLLTYLGFWTYIQFCLLLAALPLVVSIATALGVPGGNTFTRFALGARDPSKRERESLLGALEKIEGYYSLEGIKGPSNWFVIDDITLNAYVVGTTLYVHRELLKSPHFPAVLAHELGHINSLDGRMTLALRRLVIPPIYYVSRLIRHPAPGTFPVMVATSHLQAFIQAAQAWFLSFILSLLGGGFGAWLLSPLWTWYWRGREYVADEYAATLGQRGGLIEYLEEHQLFDVATPYFLSTHPYTELRIDRLMQYQDTQRSTPPAPPSTPAMEAAPSAPSPIQSEVSQAPSRSEHTPNMRAAVPEHSPPAAPKNLALNTQTAPAILKEPSEQQLKAIDHTQNSSSITLDVQVPAISTAEAVSDQNDRPVDEETHTVEPHGAEARVEETDSPSESPEAVVVEEVDQEEVPAQEDAEPIPHTPEDPSQYEESKLKDAFAEARKRAAAQSTQSRPGQHVQHPPTKTFRELMVGDKAASNSEALEDQNVFFLLGVTDGTLEERETFLTELQDVVWEDFLGFDVKLLITNDEYEEFRQLTEGQDNKEPQQQERIIAFLQPLIPDLDEILEEKTLEFKGDLVLERIIGMKAFFAGQEELLVQLDHARALIDEGQWHSAAQTLNALSDKA